MIEHTLDHFLGLWEEAGTQWVSSLSCWYPRGRNNQGGRRPPWWAVEGPESVSGTSYDRGLSQLAEKEAVGQQDSERTAPRGFSSWLEQCLVS